jgi:hypothetical protein
MVASASFAEFLREQQSTNCAARCSNLDARRARALRARRRHLVQLLH